MRPVNIGSFYRNGEDVEPPFEAYRIADIRADVEARPTRQWLIEGVWPSGDYGVLAGEKKSGKTWSALDLAASVASGTPWLGTFTIGAPGPVLVFAGEGGNRNITRRLDAITADRGLCLDDLPIIAVDRVPHFHDDVHLQAFDRTVIQTLPQLVIIDPFYLAAGGADGSSLYEMGECSSGRSGYARTTEQRC